VDWSEFNVLKTDINSNVLVFIHYFFTAAATLSFFPSLMGEGVPEGRVKDLPCARPRNTRGGDIKNSSLPSIHHV